MAGEVNSLTLALVGRMQELGERYDQTLGALVAELAQLDNRVSDHLADMGVK